MQIEVGSISFTVCATLQKYWRGIVAKKPYKKTQYVFEKNEFSSIYI